MAFCLLKIDLMTFVSTWNLKHNRMIQVLESANFLNQIWIIYDYNNKIVCNS